MHWCRPDHPGLGPGLLRAPMTLPPTSHTVKKATAILSPQHYQPDWTGTKAGCGEKGWLGGRVTQAGGAGDPGAMITRTSILKVLLRPPAFSPWLPCPEPQTQDPGRKQKDLRAAQPKDTTPVPLLLPSTFFKSWAPPWPHFSCFYFSHLWDSFFFLLSRSVGFPVITHFSLRSY